MRAPHPPYQKLKGFLTEHSLTYLDIARSLGIEVATVSNKINGTSDFTLGECLLLRDVYGISLEFYC